MNAPHLTWLQFSICWMTFKRCPNTITRGRGGPIDIQEVPGSDFWGRHNALTSFKASSYSTSNPHYDQSYPQIQTQPLYGPDNTQPGYPPPSRYASSQPGHTLPPPFASQPGYQSQIENPSQPRYPSLPDPNYQAGGGYSGSAFSPGYPTRDDYQYQSGGNMGASQPAYPAPQGPYGLQGPYGPIDHSPTQPALGTRPPSSTQPPYSTGISGYPTSGHQSPPLTTLHCSECDYTSSRQSDLQSHMQVHFPGTSSSGRRSARNG